MLIDLKKLECKRCQHSWYPTKPDVRLCPSCKSAYWDVPKKEREDVEFKNNKRKAARDM